MSIVKASSVKGKTPDLDNLTDAQIRKALQGGQASKILEEVKKYGFADPKLNDAAQNVDINTLVSTMNQGEILKIIRESLDDPGFKLKLEQERNKKGVTKRKCKECGDKFDQQKHNDTLCPACNEVKLIESGQSSIVPNTTPNCVICNKNGTNRCARCKKIYYCSRECQIKDWSKHKLNCQ